MKRRITAQGTRVIGRRRGGGLPSQRRRRASVSVELALLLPIYVVTVFGMVDIGRFFIWADQARRCAIVAANAASQLATVAAADGTDGTVGLNTILSQIAAQMPAGNAKAATGLILTAAATDAKSALSSEVQASYFAGTTATSAYSCTKANTITLPFSDPNDTVIIGEVFYSFTPFTFLGSFLSGLTQSLSLHDYSFFRVRQPTTLTKPVACS